MRRTETGRGSLFRFLRAYLVYKGGQNRRGPRNQDFLSLNLHQAIQSGRCDPEPFGRLERRSSFPVAQRTATVASVFAGRIPWEFADGWPLE